MSRGPMSTSAQWADIAFVPASGLAAEIARAWQWLVPGLWKPFLCSMIGGIFFEEQSGVYWLESGTGSVERIAADAAEFEAIVGSDPDKVDEWFLPQLVAELLDAGKHPGPGQCYAFLTLPVFAEGKYEVENLVVASARTQLVEVASVHEQLGDLPDGSRVEIKIVD